MHALYLDKGESFYGSNKRTIPLVDRLAAWQFWRSALDGVTAVYLWQKLGHSLDLARLEKSAESRGVRRAIDSLMNLTATLQDQEPNPEELARWAKKNP